MTGESHNKKIDQKERQKGFIKIIVVLVIIIIIANLLGFGPDTVWNNAILPLVQFMWKIAIWVAGVLKPILNIFIIAFDILIDLANRAWH